MNGMIILATGHCFQDPLRREESHHAKDHRRPGIGRKETVQLLPRRVGWVHHTVHIVPYPGRWLLTGDRKEEMPFTCSGQWNKPA